MENRGAESRPAEKLVTAQWEGAGGAGSRPNREHAKDQANCDRAQPQGLRDLPRCSDRRHGLERVYTAESPALLPFYALQWLVGAMAARVSDEPIYSVVEPSGSLFGSANFGGCIPTHWALTRSPSAACGVAIISAFSSALRQASSSLKR